MQLGHQSVCLPGQVSTAGWGARRGLFQPLLAPRPPTTEPGPASLLPLQPHLHGGFRTIPSSPPPGGPHPGSLPGLPDSNTHFPTHPHSRAPTLLVQSPAPRFSASTLHLRPAPAVALRPVSPQPLSQARIPEPSWTLLPICILYTSRAVAPPSRQVQHQTPPASQGAPHPVCLGPSSEAARGALAARQSREQPAGVRPWPPWGALPEVGRQPAWVSALTMSPPKNPCPAWGARPTGSRLICPPSPPTSTLSGPLVLLDSAMRPLPAHPMGRPHQIQPSPSAGSSPGRSRVCPALGYPPCGRPTPSKCRQQSLTEKAGTFW